MTDVTDSRADGAPRRSPGFWLLAFAAILLALALPFFQESWTLERLVVLLGAELALACLLLWLADPSRYVGALRGLCFLIFLAYAKHLVDELGGDRSALEAILGFVLLGLPALAYAALGGLAATWATLETAEAGAPDSRDDDAAFPEAAEAETPVETSSAQSRN